MKRFALALMLACGAAAPAGAHPDHDMYEMENPRLLVVSSAQYVVGTMVDRQILDQSWQNIQASSARLREREGLMEWVVIFRNDAAQDPAQRVLYVMVSPTGQYLAANYTGN